MKVLIISLAYPPFVGGAELAVKEITDRISSLSFDMITANLDGRQKESEKIGNINIYRVGKGVVSKYLFPFIGFKKAEELHKKNKYDVVWAIMANQAGLAALKFKKKFPNVKYILTLQEGDSLLRIWSRTWFMRSRYKKIYLKADLIQAISNFLANRAKKYGYKGKMEIVPNGVDLSSFSREFDLQELLDFKKSLGLAKEDKVVTTISRLVHKNGIDTLIKSARNLSVKVLIIGSGKLENRLKSLAQETGVRDKVLFLGYISSEKLSKYLKISDVFVRTSRSEGLGSAFLEAMAAEVPVIGTCVGGIPDFLKPEETGLFCEVGNPTDLASKISVLLSNEELKNKLVKNSKKLVLENYDWQAISQKMESVFKSL